MKVKDYSKLKKPINLSEESLIAIQLDSWEKFLQKDVPPQKRKDEGLQGVFKSVFPIEDSQKRYRIEFLHYSIGKPTCSPQEALERGKTYSAPLRGEFRLIIFDKEGKYKETIQQNVYVTQLPLMTEWGSFIVNGIERVVVNQLRRAPGVYFSETLHPSGRKLYVGEIIPYRGGWIKFQVDIRDILWVNLDKRHKVLATTLMKALGYETLEEMLTVLVDREIRKVEESVGYILAKDVKVRKDEEEYIIAKAGERVDEDLIQSLKDFEVEEVKVVKDKNPPFILQTYAQEKIKTKEEAILYIYSLLKGVRIQDLEVAESFFNRMFFDPLLFNLHKLGRVKINRKFGTNFEETSLKVDDFINMIRAMMRFVKGEIEVDDLDHMENKHVRRVNELLEDQFRIAFARLGWIIRERMVLKEGEKITPRNIINPIIVNAVINSFFETSQLSQFLDQTNPLAELTHKRRLSRLGPGGLTRQSAGLEARDVHYSHYGRMCPIETPEGQNVGIITSLASYSRVNELGELESPYYKVRDGKVTYEVEYLNAEKEKKYTIAQANTPIDEKGNITTSVVLARRRDEFPLVSSKEIDYIDVSPMQLVSVSASLIPFLEHDDADRALMGANMQRQAVPLLMPEVPIVGTGEEERVGKGSKGIVLAKEDGVVVKVDSEEVVVRSEKKGVPKFYIYSLIKFGRTNQDTCVNQKVRVKLGEKIKKGDIIADGPATERGKLALGCNLLVAFMPWQGYNFEDAIVISEEVLIKDKLTSITIHEFECEVRDTPIGVEETTSDIPNVPPEGIAHLDEEGIVEIGTEVESDDILVGKISPKGEREYSPEEKLLQAIFGEKAQDVKDTSLRVPSGIKGIITKVRMLSRKSNVKLYWQEINEYVQGIEKKILLLKEEMKKRKEVKKELEKEVSKLKKEVKSLLERYKRGDPLPHGVVKKIKVYVAERRNIAVGDKLSGRHGNKGTVAKIVPREDMPYLPDGRVVDILLNPLGVPSRMNIGQILETHLGWAVKELGMEVITPVFNGATVQEIKEELKKAGLPEDGKTILYDGQTGEPFKERVTVGYIYMMKLSHMVEEKIHSRSIGSYALITQQPLGGKAQAGGQRFGEMEVWALEGYGAAYTLQEMLTIKSDDVVGRRKSYEAIIKGKKLPEPTEPLSFNVLLRELNALSLVTELIREGKDYED